MNEKKKKKIVSGGTLGGISLEEEWKGSETGSKLLFLKYFFSLFSFSFSPSLFLYLYRSIRIVNDDREERGKEKRLRVRLQGDVYFAQLGFKVDP